MAIWGNFLANKRVKTGPITALGPVHLASELALKQGLNCPQWQLMTQKSKAYS